ncbi:UNVERIFIED_CONTAM: Glutathione S-transferase U17 [Sesamum calycinum]|uniref:Glutathione S-transferase U17 n=1 Tax=Sesamum calycinum TaxID=2727403 RepID=A0AAW2PQD5_9LAMI
MRGLGIWALVKEEEKGPRPVWGRGKGLAAEGKQGGGLRQRGRRMVQSCGEGGDGGKGKEGLRWRGLKGGGAMAKKGKGGAMAAKWFPRVRDGFFSEEEAAKNAFEESEKGLLLLEQAFTKCNKGQKFFGGERIGYLDIALGSHLAWIRVIEQACNVSLIDDAKTPNLNKWAHDFPADVAVKDVLPSTDKLYEFAKLLISVMKGTTVEK